jgi:hypothetical protein
MMPTASPRPMIESMTEPADPTGPPRLGPRLTAFRAAGVAGLVFAVLMTVALLLMRDEPPSSALLFEAWWETYEPRLFAAIYLIPFAGIAFLWLLAALRRRIGRSEDQFYATVLLGSGLLFVAMLFATAAAATASTVGGDLPRDSAYDAFILGRTMGRAFFYVFAIKMAAAFMLVSSTIIRQTRIMPRWFSAVGLVAGVLLLVSITAFEPVALVFPAWVATLSVLLLRAEDPETTVADRMRDDGPPRVGAGAIPDPGAPRRAP